MTGAMAAHRQQAPRFTPVRREYLATRRRRIMAGLTDGHSGRNRSWPRSTPRRDAPALTPAQCYGNGRPTTPQPTMSS